MRSESAPASGATVRNVTVHGTSRSPAASGPWPSPVCISCAKKNTQLNSEANVKKIAALPAEKPRERKKRIGSIGSRARSSHATNAATSSTPAASEATTSTLSQPATLPRTRPQTMPSAPPVTSARPGMSSAVSGPWLSLIFARTNGMAISPIGTLTQKTHCQARPSTTAPPTSGPRATAMPVMALKMPMAAPRRSGGNEPVSSARPSGMISAAPAPCRARPAISQPASGASAQAAEAAAKSPSPVAYSRRLP